MIRLIKYLPLIFVISLFHKSIAWQDISQSLVQNIVSSYNNFDYPETDRLLEIALNDIEKFSAPDQIQVYQYSAFRKFQQGKPFQAREFFWKLLDIDPTFVLDPLTTPPKLLSLFQKTKIEYLENLERRLQEMQKDFSYHPMPWRSLIFPGWEQLYRGHRLKGTIWVVAGGGCLIGLIQSIIRAERENDEYLNATIPEDITQKYDEYNRLYQSRYYWAYGFIAVWLASHVDAMFFTPVKSPAKLSLLIRDQRPALFLTINF